jgi:Bacterial TSP3 repeat
MSVRRLVVLLCMLSLGLGGRAASADTSTRCRRICQKAIRTCHRGGMSRRTCRKEIVGACVSGGAQVCRPPKPLDACLLGCNKTITECIRAGGGRRACRRDVTKQCRKAGFASICADAAPAAEDVRVVSAVATGNTTVLVQFNQPMGDSATEPAHYSIVAAGQTAARLLVTAPLTFAGPDRTTVQLTTLAQSDVPYVLTVATVLSTAGTALAARQVAGGLVVDPSTAGFRGVPPAGLLPDTDGDGLSDDVEQRGWTVTIANADGTSSTRFVTSDPNRRDTDGDGLDDREELRRGTDPRKADSDGDGLTDNEELNLFYSSPTSQDTDRDGVEDGDEVNVFKSSPLLADTDGDGFDDGRELFSLFRDPRVADIPQPEITVGNMRLQIDEAYTFENSQGQTVTESSQSQTELKQSTDQKFARSDSSATKLELGGKVSAGVEAKISAEPELTLKSDVEFEAHQSSEYTSQVSEESARSAEQTYEQSLAKGREFSKDAKVSREVKGAAVSVDLSIAGGSDIAFSLKNVVVTVQAPSRAQPGVLLPVATLVPQAGGDGATFNLGPLVPAVGPIIFESRDVFPSLVDDLLRDPRGLVFSVANADITDEMGRNFAFASQEIHDRTAAILIDAGDDKPQRYLVAASGFRDDKGYVGGGFVGGFGDDGKLTGIPLDLALQDVLHLTKNGATPDAVLAGPDGVADSVAQGDDVQLVPPGTTGLGDRDIVVSAGANGILDTTAAGDDVAAVTIGYETSPSCNAATTFFVADGGNGIAETQVPAGADDIQVVALNAPVPPGGGAIVRPGPDGFISAVPLGDDVLYRPGNPCHTDAECPGGACTGREVLVRIGNRRTGDFHRFWITYRSAGVPEGTDFGKIVLKPGHSLGMAFVQDRDVDGLFAREEFVNGSSDLNKDTDGDGLPDFTEEKIGWTVATGAVLRQVFPDPASSDRDGDGLLDPDEKALGTDPRSADTDGDGVSDFDEVHGYLVGRAIVEPEPNGMIVAGADGIADTVATGTDIQAVPVGTQGLHPQTVVIVHAPGQPLATAPAAHDALVTTANGTADTPAAGDDQQQVLVAKPVAPGAVIVLPGLDGAFASTPSGDDVLLFGRKVVVTDPLTADADGDNLPDGAERDLGGDPTDPTDAKSFRDTDGDGLTDVQEELIGWDVAVTQCAPAQCVPQATPGCVPCDPASGACCNLAAPALNCTTTTKHVFSNRNLADTDGDGLPDFVERAIGSDPTRVDTDGDGLNDVDEFADFETYLPLNGQFPGFHLNPSGSAAYGTDLNSNDTDRDGLSDRFELVAGYQTLVPGDSRPRRIHTDPLAADTDLDGLPDSNEIRCQTDASAPDSDGDGRIDGRELAVQTNPRRQDVRVTVTSNYINFTAGDDPFTNAFAIFVQQAGQAYPGLRLSDNLHVGTANGCAIGGEPDHNCGFISQFFGFNIGGCKDVSEPLCGSCLFDNFHNMFFETALNDSTSFALEPGEGFIVHGYDHEVLNCPGPPGAPVDGFISPLCSIAFNQVYRFEDLINQNDDKKGFKQFDMDLSGGSSGNCQGHVTYQIAID